MSSAFPPGGDREPFAPAGTTPTETAAPDPPRPATAKDRLEYVAFRAGIGLFANIPRRWALRVGAGLGELFFRLDAKDRRTGLTNLRIAFPEKSEDERVAILRESCHNIGRVGAEICHLSHLTRENLDRYVTFRDRAAWDAALADIAQHGGLILTGHFGNWELLAYAHGLLGHPVALVHRPMRNRLVDAGIAALRSGSGTVALPKRAAAKEVLRTLRRKGIVVIPIDQNQSAGLGVFVDFFGKQACTTFGLARLARISRASVYPVFLVRQGTSDRHVVEILPRVEWVDTGDLERDIAVNTQRYTAVFEEMLRRHPEQWIWFHKRWRTRPAGEPQFY